MRIGIDARLLSYRRGMGNYVYSLLNAIGLMDTRHEFVLFVDAAHARRTRAAEPVSGRWKLVGLPGSSYVIEEQLALPLLLLRHRVDLLHCPANTFPLLLPGKVKLAVTIHDVMYLMPECELGGRSSIYQRLGRTYRALLVRSLKRRAVSLLTVSHRSAADIGSYLGIPRERLTVTHEAAPPYFRRLDDSDRTSAVRARFGLGDDFILALGGIDPRKNTEAVFKAYCAFRRRSNLRHKLAVVGLPASAGARFARIARHAGFERDIVFPGFVSEEELVLLYNAASMFVYPSRYEGFGLPVLEAMSCGTPVVASRAGAIPEVAGDAAILVDAEDTRAMSDSMLELAGNKSLRAALVERGLRRASQFSWERCARETIDAYERTRPYEYSVRDCPPAVSADPR